jgi:hypothetical protein
MRRLLLAWLAALGVVAAGLLIDSLLLLAVARHVENWPLELANVLFVHVPWVLTVLLATGTAVRLHGTPRWADRGLLAALGVPAVVIVAGIAVGAARGTVLGGLLAAAEVALGVVLAWRLTDRGARATADSYFAN